MYSTYGLRYICMILSLYLSSFSVSCLTLFASVIYVSVHAKNPWFCGESYTFMYSHIFFSSHYLSMVSDASLPPGAPSKVIALAEEPPSRLFACSISLALPTLFHSFSYTFHSPVFPSPKWCIFPIKTFNLTRLNFYHKLFTLHPLSVTRLALGIPFLPFHHSTPHSTALVVTHATSLIIALIFLLVPS